MPTEATSRQRDNETQAEIEQLTVSVFMSLELLRPASHQMQKPAWLSRARNLLPSIEEKYLDSLSLDPRDQFNARERRNRLEEGETFAINKRHPGDLEAQLPMPKDRLHRTR